MDLTTISTAIGTIKTAYELSKIISDSAGSLEDAEIKLKLSELLNALVDTKNQISDIKLELIEKNEEIQRLKNQIRIQNELVFEQPYYWRMIDEKQEGPYCQKCFDDKSKLIRLQDEKGGSWRCLVCSSYVTDKNYKEI